MRLGEATLETLDGGPEPECNRSKEECMGNTRDEQGGIQEIVKEVVKHYSKGPWSMEQVKRILEGLGIPNGQNDMGQLLGFITGKGAVMQQEFSQTVFWEPSTF